MDFSNRGSQSAATPRPGSSFEPENNTTKSSSKRSKSGGDGKWGLVGKVLLLVAVAVMLLGVIGMLILSGNKSEKNLVDSNKFQAVFLTNDQVYFGKISDLNSKYLVLNNIYYLRTQDSSATSSTSSSNNVSLVKLGCELHKPYDRMVISTDQVQFWENLQADGQVAQAVASYAKTNPNNTCSNTTSNSASGSSVQGSGSTTNTKSTSTDTTTKP